MHTNHHRRSITLTALVLALLLGAAAGLPAAAEAPEGVVNVNTAEVGDLVLLPRVGPALAGRILEFREENGPFKATDDLLLVRGVGERTLEMLKPFITLEGKTTLEEKVRVSDIRSSEEAEGAGSESQGNQN
jgi:competence protein ComEA